MIIQNFVYTHACVTYKPSLYSHVAPLLAHAIIHRLIRSAKRRMVFKLTVSIALKNVFSSSGREYLQCSREHFFKAPQQYSI